MIDIYIYYVVQTKLQCLDPIHQSCHINRLVARYNELSKVKVIKTFDINYIEARSTVHAKFNNIY